MKTVIDHPIEERYLSDSMKDQLGEISCSKPEYYVNGNLRLLQESDLKLPTRVVQNVNKGSFGHVSVVMGEKPGAGIIAATAAFAFGAGLVTLLCQGRPVCCPYELMDSPVPPAATNALALGMGLGVPSAGAPTPGSQAARALAWLDAHPDVACVFDADILKYKGIKELILRRKKVVLTPHPKEFATLLGLCGLGEYDVPYIAEHRFELVRHRPGREGVGEHLGQFLPGQGRQRRRAGRPCGCASGAGVCCLRRRRQRLLGPRPGLPAGKMQLRYDTF